MGVSTSSAAAKKEKALDKVENEMVMFSKNFLIQIKGGTLTKIIERCTNESAPENSFMDTFLLTYRTYISPSELMDQLFERYNSPIPEVPEDVDPFAYQEAKKIIRLRVGNLLKRWLSNHFHDFNENDELLKKLASYVEKTFSLNEKNLASTIIQLSSQKNQTEMTASTVYGAKPPAPIVPKSVIILDMDPTEISRQLCLFEQNLFKKIHPKECLNQAWNKVERAERAPHIIQMIEHFNKVGRWVVYEIINQANIANRVKVMKHFIKVAIKCREYNNFNGCQEIIAGFGSSAVYRLHKSWGKLNKNEKQLIAQFNAIKETMSNNKSYNRYRTELKHINPPCVPYLGVFLTDLTFIEEGNPDYLATVDGRNDIINFDKMRKVAAVIEKILIYQPVSYNFEKVNVIYEHLQNSLSEMDEKSAFDISRQLEPKE
uniref:Ras-GEF domain-containing protein n=1 Tax=Arcella intermedia TaxID=1963864 RepID=A0A6B2L305_9EUKA